MMELTPRQENILTAVVEQFIATREPVSSAAIAAGYTENGKLLSSATVRNTLHELEDAGYLEKSHHSSGRAPSKAGYRFYVNRLVSTYGCLQAPAESRDVLNQTTGVIEDTRSLLMQYLDFLKDETGCVSLLLFPDTVSLSLNRIEFVRLSDRKVLAILLSRSNLYRQVLVEMDRPVSYEELTAVANYLNRHCYGKTLFQIRAELIRLMKNRVDQLNQTAKRILDTAYRYVTRLEQDDEELVVRGMSNLFSQLDTGDRARLRELVASMEEKHRMVELISACLDRDVTVFLGGELADVDFSMVVSPYGIGSGTKGAFGILGPICMDYRRVMGTMKLLTESLMGTIISRSMQQNE